MPSLLCCCGGCSVFSDDFNRADSSTVGNSWVETAGSWEISGNKLQTSSSNATLTQTTGRTSNEWYVSCGITANASSNVLGVFAGDISARITFGGSSTLAIYDGETLLKSCTIDDYLIDETVTLELWVHGNIVAARGLVSDSWFIMDFLDANASDTTDVGVLTKAIEASGGTAVFDNFDAEKLDTGSSCNIPPGCVTTCPCLEVTIDHLTNSILGDECGESSCVLYLPLQQDGCYTPDRCIWYCNLGGDDIKLEIIPPDGVLQTTYNLVFNGNDDNPLHEFATNPDCSSWSELGYNIGFASGTTVLVKSAGLTTYACETTSYSTITISKASSDCSTCCSKLAAGAKPSQISVSISGVGEVSSGCGSCGSMNASYLADETTNTPSIPACGDDATPAFPAWDLCLSPYFLAIDVCGFDELWVLIDEFIMSVALISTTNDTVLEWTTSISGICPIDLASLLASPISLTYRDFSGTCWFSDQCDGSSATVTISA